MDGENKTLSSIIWRMRGTAIIGRINEKMVATVSPNVFCQKESNDRYNVFVLLPNEKGDTMHVHEEDSVKAKALAEKMVNDWFKEVCNG